MITFNVAAANAMMTALRDAADAGSGPARIRIYDGNVPYDEFTFLPNATGDASGNTVLAELICADPCATVANKRIIFNPIAPEPTNLASGTATFFRLFDSDDNVILQGTVGLDGAGADMALSKVDLTAGAETNITYIVIGMP